MLASLNTPGETFIRAKKSRNHTELFLKILKFQLILEIIKILILSNLKMLKN